MSSEETSKENSIENDNSVKVKNLDAIVTEKLQTPSKSGRTTDAKKDEKMPCCTPKCQKAAFFGSGIFLIIFGIILIFTWHGIYNHIIKSELSLENEHTTQYGFWKETPIPMYLDIYLFNWTNAHTVENGKPWTTPELQELGPYVFKEVNTRANVRFNDNDTISFNTIRTWHFVPERSNGSLDDKVTTLNAIALTVGGFVKHKGRLTILAVDFMLREKHTNLTVTHTVREFLFDGYNDTLLDILNRAELKNIKIPYDRFGWFYSRNGSSTYDGNYTMYTGADDLQKLGIVTRWNQSPRVPEYPGYCGMVNGTTGELWYPLKDAKTVSLFLSDVCSSLTLEANGSYSAFGLEGKRYQQTERLFDNGTKYPEMKCFTLGGNLPSGVRNVSACKQGAPAFMSMPHFYMADPSYRKAVKGMKPDPEVHNFYMSLEPTTGLPLKVQASLQVSLYLSNIPGFKIFENVQDVMLPVLWFKQHAEITPHLASLAKLLLILPSIGNYTAFGIIGLGHLLLCVGFFITLRRRWSGLEEEQPLTQNHL